LNGERVGVSVGVLVVRARLDQANSSTHTSRDREPVDAEIEAAADRQAELAVRLNPTAGGNGDGTEVAAEVHRHPPGALATRTDVDGEVAVHR